MKWSLYMLGVCLFYLINVTSGKTESVPQTVPANIRLTTQSTTTIQVSWKRPPQHLINGQLVGYRIKYQPQGGLSTTIDVGNITQYTMTPLRKNTLYTVWMAVRNNAYSGKWSTPIQAKTLADFPQAAPTDIQIHVISPKKIKVNWKRPSMQLINSKITGYMISYIAQGDKIPQRVDVAMVTTKTLSNLVPLTSYTLYIAVINGRYYGIWSKGYRVRLPADAPDCPPNMISVQAVTSKSIRVTWSSLRDSKQCRLNGVLRGYKVAYRLKRHGSRVMYKDIKDSGAITAVVTGLDKYTEYSFQVLAYTVKDGPMSNAIVERTDEEDCRNSHTAGVKDRSIIPNNRMTASSVRKIVFKYYEPFYARLGSSSFWSPASKNNPDDYLQIDLGSAHVICAVATQGGSWYDRWWVTEYKLSFAINKSTWRKYKEDTKYKIFPGNKDFSSVVKNRLTRPVAARYIRFTPTQFNNWKAMRVEVYVNSQAPDCPPNMKSVLAVSSRSVRISWSTLKDSKDCRLNGVLRGYKVAYKYLYGGKIKYQNVRGSRTTTTLVTGLDKYTEYSFQVLAYTLKDGPLSKETVTRTKEDMPDGPPE